MLQRLKLEALRIGILFGAAVAGISGWYFVIIPSAPAAAVAIVACVGIGIFSVLRDNALLDIGYDDARRERPPQEVAPRPPKRALPEDVIEQHLRMQQFVQDAAALLNDAIEASKSANRGLLGVNETVAAVQSEVAELRNQTAEQANVLTEIDGVIRKRVRPTKAPSERPIDFAPPHMRADVEQSSEIPPEKMPGFLARQRGALMGSTNGTGVPVNLDELDKALQRSRLPMAPQPVDA